MYTSFKKWANLRVAKRMISTHAKKIIVFRKNKRMASDIMSATVYGCCEKRDVIFVICIARMLTVAEFTYVITTTLTINVLLHSSSSQIKHSRTLLYGQKSKCSSELTKHVC